LLLTPGYANAIAGPCSAVKLGQRVPLKLNAALQVNLVETAIPRDRKPTSIPGLLKLIRQTFAESRDADGILGAAARGETPVFIVCQGLTEVERAVKLAGELGLNASAVIPEPGPGLPEALAGGELGVVLPPLPSSPRERTLGLPAALAEAGVPIAFSSFAPMTQEHDLRTSAALAAAAGLPDTAALRALTLGAAEMLGIADRVGSLEVGKDGDVVIFGGHPLDLSAPVEVVIINGQIIYEREAD
jgi:imidazolonepropionase-like amidohydrolase